MDIWEANSISAAVTPHSCDTASQTMCLGDACGGTYSTSRYGGTCDPDGCDFNSYRMGDTSFYGPGKTVNTNSVFTVVTQFITTDGTATGTLKEIKRFYVQNGVTIPNSVSTISGVSGNSITAAFCDAQKTVFGDTNSWNTHGSFASMTTAMKNGMVLVLSLWDDYYANMLWLDSTYPVGSTKLGAARGTCDSTSGVPATVESTAASSYVIYSNIKVGALNSTFNAAVSSSSTSTKASTLSTSTTKASTTSTTSASSSTNTALAAHYAQCGGYPGIYTGPTACVSPYVCTYNNAYYSQCL
jgi:cellulose 1,4-beta-cellobiosidase